MTTGYSIIAELIAKHPHQTKLQTVECPVASAAWRADYGANGDNRVLAGRVPDKSEEQPKWPLPRARGGRQNTRVNVILWMLTSTDGEPRTARRQILDSGNRSRIVDNLLSKVGRAAAT